MTWSHHTHSLSSRINRTCWRWRQNARRPRASAPDFPETSSGIDTLRRRSSNQSPPPPVLSLATGATLQPDTQQAHSLPAAKNFPETNTES